MRYRARGARREDASEVARIYNEGIADRLATFETRHRSADEVAAWLEEGFPLVVVETEDGRIAGWASATPYRPQRPVYAGVGEFSVYVGREDRGGGAGRAALEALLEEAAERGLWKLVSRIFPENRASLALAASLGFREVGVYRRHAKLDGEWRDCVIVERLVGEAEG